MNYSNRNSSFGRRRSVFAQTPNYSPAAPAQEDAPAVQDDAGVKNTAQPEALQQGAAVLQAPAAAAQVDAPATPPPVSEAPHQYVVSVDEIRLRLDEIGIAKSKDSIQRYCREGRLDCERFGLMRRYFATEASVTSLIETLQKDAPASDSVQLHEAAEDDTSTGMQLHAAVPDETMNNDNELHAAAAIGTQSDAGARSFTQGEQPQAFAPDASMVEFLKDQLKVKDEQLKVKDEQIATMLERDRETNILIRELQGALTSTVEALPGVRNNRGRDPERPLAYRPEGQGDNPQPDSVSGGV